jgi:hypothetical protein
MPRRQRSGLINGRRGTLAAVDITSRFPASIDMKGQPMAKGQKRSNKEAKKPKKELPKQAKTGPTSPFVRTPGTSEKAHSKKS